MVWIIILITAAGPSALPFKYGSQMDCESAGRDLQITFSNSQDPLRPGPRVSFFCFKGPV
jgi:hypothetical protein